MINGTSATIARPNSPSRMPPPNRSAWALGGFANIRTTTSAKTEAAPVMVAVRFTKIPQLNLRVWSCLPQQTATSRSVWPLEIVNQVDLAKTGRGPAEHDQRRLRDGRRLGIKNFFQSLRHRRRAIRQRNASDWRFEAVERLLGRESGDFADDAAHLPACIGHDEAAGLLDRCENGRFVQRADRTEIDDFERGSVVGSVLGGPERLDCHERGRDNGDVGSSPDDIGLTDRHDERVLGNLALKNEQ